MPDTDTELFLEEEEETEDAALDTSFLVEPLAAPGAEAAAPVKVELDSSGIGQTIADALKGQGAENTEMLRTLAKEFIAGQPKPGAPALTKEQIAARNTSIQAALLDVTGDVDLVETLRGIVAPMLQEGIEGTLRTVRPEADNLAAGQGERFVRDFKRDTRDGVNEKLRAKYEAEIDKLVPEARYAAIAQATPAQRKAFFEEIEDRAYARSHRAYIKDAPPRGQVTGSGSAGAKSPLQAAFSALPKEEQRDADRMAKAFARARGLKEGTKEFEAARREKVAEYLEGGE